MSQCKSPGIGIRPQYGDAANPPGIERKRAVFVFQQYDGFPRSLQGDLIVLRTVHLTIGGGQIGLIRSVEQPDEEFHAKHVPDPAVQQLLGDKSLPEELPQRHHIGLGCQKLQRTLSPASMLCRTASS